MSAIGDSGFEPTTNVDTDVDVKGTCATPSVDNDTEDYSATQTVAPEVSAQAWSEHEHEVKAGVVEARAHTPAAEEPGMFSRFGSWLDDRVSDVSEAADQLEDAALDVANDVSSSVQSGFNSVVSDVRQLGGQLSDAADGVLSDAGEAIGEARRIGGELVNAGERAVQVAGEGLSELADDAEDVVRSGLETARGVGEDIINVGSDIVNSVTEPLDAEEQICQLNSDGDTLTYELGAMAQVEIRGEAAGQIQVKQVGEGDLRRYEVTVGGEAALGGVLQLGAKAGGNASAEAQAMARAGGAVTFSFDNPQDAARAVQITARSAAVAGATAGGTPFMGGLTQAAIGPSADDLEFMGEHAHAIELRGGVSGELAGSLGLGLDDNSLRLGGLGAKLAADQRIGARLVLPQGGNPARLTLYGQGTLSGEASANLGLNAVGADGASGDGLNKLGVGASAGGQIQLRLEQSFDLPSNVAVDDLMRDPDGTMLRVADQMAASQEMTATLSGQGTARATGLGGGSRGFELKLTGRPGQLQPAIDAIQERGLEQGLAALDRTVQIEGKTTSASTHGWRVAPEITAFGVGVGVTAAAERNDETTTSQGTLRPSDVHAWLRQRGVIE